MRVEQLEDKHPAETVQYTFSLVQNSAFVKNAEVINQQPSFSLVDKADITTDLPGMIFAKGYDADNDLVTIDVQGGVTDHTYLIGGRVTCASGRVYTVIGKMKVDDLDLPLPPSGSLTPGATGVRHRGIASAVTNAGVAVVFSSAFVSAGSYIVGARGYITGDETNVVDNITIEKTASGITLTPLIGAGQTAEIEWWAEETSQ